MRPTINKYKELFSNKTFLLTFFISLIFFIGSLFINFFAGTYAQESISNPVTDIILSNTRAYDLDGIFIYGSYLFWLFFIYLCLIKPQKMPYTLKTVALFIIIRSLFISMTHIGPFPNQLVIDPASLISDFTFGGDLFFSGHTGLPFLMALIYWKDVRLRVIFIVASLIFAVTVLLAHLHYTIDVFSAFFITYTIYHMAEKLFKGDRELFYKG